MCAARHGCCISKSPAIVSFECFHALTLSPSPSRKRPRRRRRRGPGSLYTPGIPVALSLGSLSPSLSPSLSLSLFTKNYAWAHTLLHARAVGGGGQRTIKKKTQTQTQSEEEDSAQLPHCEELSLRSLARLRRRWACIAEAKLKVSLSSYACMRVYLSHSYACMRKRH